MRTERSRVARVTRLAWGMTFSALLLTGCPGTLEHKERFLVDAGDAGSGDGDAAPNHPGSGAGAGAGAGTAGTAGGPCGDVIERIFVPSCGGTGCHGSTGAQQDLDLVSPGVRERVVGVTGTGCASTLADPANPEASLLYRKLLPTPPCGSPMPLARPPLSDPDVACVLAWIAAQ